VTYLGLAFICVDTHAFTQLLTHSLQFVCPVKVKLPNRMLTCCIVSCCFSLIFSSPLLPRGGAIPYDVKES